MMEARDQRRRQELRELARAVNAGMSGKLKEAAPEPAEDLDESKIWWGKSAAE